MTRRSLLTWFAALALVILVLPRAGSASASSLTPVTLAGTIPTVVSNAQVVGTRPTTDTVTLAISLSLRDRDGLLAFIQALNDPSSPYYHHPLTLAQANQLFNPTAADEQQVVSWLQSNGLTVTNTYANHLIVDARGTVGQVETMLSVTINQYRITVGSTTRLFYAPDRDPTIDGSVSSMVQAITGLDTYPRFHTSLSTDSDGTAHASPAYYPQDFANAYDVNPLWNAGYNGAGQSIGITLWETPPDDAVLQEEASTTGASVPTQANGRLNVIKVDGGVPITGNPPTNPSPDDGEAGMDIEYSSGMAPGAIVNYYEAPTDSQGNPTDQGLLDALNLAGTQGNRQITNSWGECEPSSSDAWMKSAEAIFSANAATGHSYFFSSGDNGSWCDPTGNGCSASSTTCNPYPNYPASSPYVNSVGGTSFTRPIPTSGTYYTGEESAWRYSATADNGNPLGSGGGYSRIFARPSWQVGTGLLANGKRGYPDISADADPNTGAYVCYGSNPDVTSSDDSCDWIGGTSLSSPLWAGMTAVLNQYLTAQGKGGVGFLAPSLYALKSKLQTYTPFHDVTQGTNGKYNATTYWDAVTGWGTPDLYNIARDLFAAGGTGSIGSGGGTVAPGSSVIGNGDFELGPGAPWTEASTAGHELIGTSGQVHVGSYAAWFCGYNTCNDRLTQTFRVPASVTSAVLTYWVRADTTDTVACADRLMTQVRTTTGALIASGPTVCNSNTGWAQKTLTLTSIFKYRLNQTLQLTFNGLSGAYHPSDFYLDDVSLVIS